jgi:hypothetical protein
MDWVKIKTDWDNKWKRKKPKAYLDLRVFQKQVDEIDDGGQVRTAVVAVVEDEHSVSERWDRVGKKMVRG